MMTRPPEPMMEPSFWSASYSRGVSSKLAGMTPPDGPPDCTALNCLPFGGPPPISKIMSRNDVPKGTSARPVLVILPASAKTFVPLAFSVPMVEYHAPPRRMMMGTVDQVSTLLMLVGLPHKPDCAGNGGRGMGWPRRPSMDRMSAVSSPHTNAPAPMRSSMSKSKPLSKMFLPSTPSL